MSAAEMTTAAGLATQGRTADDHGRPLFKVLRNGQSMHGGTLAWPLPTQDEAGTWTPGAWVAVDDATAVVVCQSGLHLTTEPSRWWGEGATCYAVEADAACWEEAKWESDDSDKVVVRRCRLLHPIDWTAVRVFDCGHHRVATGHAVARGHSTVEAWDHSTVTARDHSTVTARDHSTVEARGRSTVVRGAYHDGLMSTRTGFAVLVDRSRPSEVTIWLPDGRSLTQTAPTVGA